MNFFEPKPDKDEKAKKLRSQLNKGYDPYNHDTISTRQVEIDVDTGTFKRLHERQIRTNDWFK